jgi:hypothetical protein
VRPQTCSGLGALTGLQQTIASQRGDSVGRRRLLQRYGIGPLRGAAGGLQPRHSLDASIRSAGGAFAGRAGAVARRVRRPKACAGDETRGHGRARIRGAPTNQPALTPAARSLRRGRRRRGRCVNLLTAALPPVWVDVTSSRRGGSNTGRAAALRARVSARGTHVRASGAAFPPPGLTRGTR